ncbi:MAG: hypothetical protein HQ453_04480 [Actinobacteria bacterium]|nr:hypothetical protein [Actinomycetota bacterium]
MASAVGVHQSMDSCPLEGSLGLANSQDDALDGSRVPLVVPVCVGKELGSSA